MEEYFVKQLKQMEGASSLNEQMSGMISDWFGTDADDNLT